jgi:hypothetical protein
MTAPANQQLKLPLRVISIKALENGETVMSTASAKRDGLHALQMRPKSSGISSRISCSWWMARMRDEGSVWLDVSLESVPLDSRFADPG